MIMPPKLPHAEGISMTMSMWKGISPSTMVCVFDNNTSDYMLSVAVLHMSLLTPQNKWKEQFLWNGRKCSTGTDYLVPFETGSSVPLPVDNPGPDYSLTIRAPKIFLRTGICRATQAPVIRADYLPNFPPGLFETSDIYSGRIIWPLRRPYLAPVFLSGYILQAV
jgi:hypothetical protein